jgi:hypothetical protein
VKLLLENWRKLLEGEVIQFPRQPQISEADLQFTLMVEDSMLRRLEAIYGDISKDNIEKFEKLNEIINEMEKLLRK